MFGSLLGTRLGALGLASLLPAASALAQASEPVLLALRDRIVAVVDEDPILASDIDRAIALGLSERRQGEGEEAFRRRVLDSLIVQRIRLHEVSRFGIEQVPVEAIEKQVETIRARFLSEEAFRRQLAEVDLDLDGLRQLVARQLAVLTYFEEFLGPRIFVDLEEIREYYEGTLVPELEARGETAPPIEDVREEIRNLLKERRLNEAIEARTEELRRDADVLSFFDSEHEELPPVVLEIGPSPRPSPARGRGQPLPSPLDSKPAGAGEEPGGSATGQAPRRPPGPGRAPGTGRGSPAPCAGRRGSGRNRSW
jgi:hypothetical protein